MMDCAAVDELLPAIAFGNVSPREAREVEAHLASCQGHQHLADLQRVASMLPMSVPPVPPRDELKHHVMARVYGDLEPRPLRRLWWQRTWSLAAAAVLAALALGLGVRDWMVSSQLAAAPMSWQLAPALAGTRTTGALVYLPRQNLATLTLEGLQPLAPDRVYEVWLIKAGKPEPAGVFKPSADGSASSILDRPPSGFDTVAVTEEPGPQGSSTPTSQPLVTGSIGQ
ncbi:MAG TPA: anti-sigma factor [Chloroflexota bacterium]|nr:anti-sigma factor [Chloroflexota bacterium]